MSNIQVISDTLRSPQTSGKLMLALGFTDQKDSKAKNEAAKYCSSVLAEIEKTVGDSKKDLSVCHPDSIVKCMVDAAKFRIMIDGRQHAHLIKYGNSATLQMGYRGYLAKIKETYPDADFTVEPIYNGDACEVWHEDGNGFYKLSKKDPFASGEGMLKGILFAVKYTDNGRMVSKVMPVPKERIDRAKKAAKQKFVWESDYIEKAKAAAIKNACKHMFASITALQEAINYDNEKNHDPNQVKASSGAQSLIDSINSSIDDVLPTHDTTEDDPEVIEGEIVDDEGDMIVPM